MTSGAVRSGRRFQWALVAWTVVIWGSRIRNIVVDDDLAGFDRMVSIVVAMALLGAALLLGYALVTSTSWSGAALAVLVAIGILRWTIRGPIILLSDEWEVSFKIVHTILWCVTVIVSVLAWREHRHAQAR